MTFNFDLLQVMYHEAHQGPAVRHSGAGVHPLLPTSVQPTQNQAHPHFRHAHIPLDGAGLRRSEACDIRCRRDPEWARPRDSDTRTLLHLVNRCRSPRRNRRSCLTGFRTTTISESTNRTTIRTITISPEIRHSRRTSSQSFRTIGFLHRPPEPHLQHQLLTNPC